MRAGGRGIGARRMPGNDRKILSGRRDSRKLTGGGEKKGRITRNQKAVKGKGRGEIAGAGAGDITGGQGPRARGTVFFDAHQETDGEKKDICRGGDVRQGEEL